MLPFTVVFGQNLFGAFYSLLSRRLAVRLPHAQLQVASVLFVITFAIVAPMAYWYGGVHFEALLRWWPYFAVAGCLTTLSFTMLLLAFRHLDAAMGTLMTTLHIVLAVIGGLLVLGESLGLQQVVGSLAVLAAVVYALSVHVNKRERRNWTKGISFAVVSSFCFAIGVVIEKFLLGQVNPQSYMVWSMGMQCLAAVLVGLLIGRRHFKDVLQLRHAALIAGTGLMRSGMAALFIMSLVVFKSLCVAVILAGLRPLFVAILGAWLLGEERFLMRKVIASVVAAIGVAVMFWK